MTTPIRIAHYLNQFFAGIGGEERADVGVSDARGASRARAARSRPLSATRRGWWAP